MYKVSHTIAVIRYVKEGMTSAIISVLIVTDQLCAHLKKSSMIYRTLRFEQYLHSFTAKCLIVLPVEVYGTVATDLKENRAGPQMQG